ncbi:hypothetical protein Bbelb_278730 [Branchiostoma belcheri]|nr:hypothetical protein Bbelb_278730 [Branchiostoma belcheri]
MALASPRRSLLHRRPLRSQGDSMTRFIYHRAEVTALIALSLLFHGALMALSSRSHGDHGTLTVATTRAVLGRARVSLLAVFCLVFSGFVVTSEVAFTKGLTDLSSRSHRALITLPWRSSRSHGTLMALSLHSHWRSHRAPMALSSRSHRALIAL